MYPGAAIPKFRPQLGATVLAEMSLIQRSCLVIVSLISAVTLAAWLVPPLDRFLPSIWPVMKANTAVCVLLSVLSLRLSRRRRSEPRVVVSQVFASLVALIAGVTLLETVLGVNLGVDTLLAPDPWGSMAGRMSPQSALSFLLLSAVMMLIRSRTSLMARVADLLAIVLCLTVLVITSGYFFGALHVFGASSAMRTSPQTLISLILLSLVAFGRRAERGIFGILFGEGEGGKIARIATPVALLLPYVLETARAGSIREGWMSGEYATAVASSLVAMLAFGLVLGLAWRIDKLEREIRDLSLRDELTGVYNRRGFYLLAEQALRVAQRASLDVSVLFIDLDGLKAINDSLGHEVGSEFLREVAVFLEDSFRRTDVIGRIGGDEFAVVGQSNEKSMLVVIERMHRAAEAKDAEPGRQYPFRFSCGHVTSKAESRESLDDLLSRADAMMYEAKRLKKAMAEVTASQM